MRADQIDQRQRQPAPGLDQQLIARIERLHVFQLLAAMELIVVMQRLRLESPVFLECEGTGAAAAVLYWA